MNRRSPFFERQFTLFGTVVHPFRVDWVNRRSLLLNWRGRRICRLAIATRRLTCVLRVVGRADAIVGFDDPSIAVRLAPPISQFDGQVAAFDKAPKDFLNASLGHATVGRESRDAGPGAAQAFVDEIGEDIGEHEGERRQLGVGAHLFKPEKFLARKGDTTLRRRIVDARNIGVVVWTKADTGRAASHIWIRDHPRRMGRVGPDRNNLDMRCGLPAANTGDRRHFAAGSGTLSAAIARMDNNRRQPVDSAPPDTLRQETLEETSSHNPSQRFRLKSHSTPLACMTPEIC